MTSLRLKYRHLEGKPDRQQIWGEAELILEGHCGYEEAGKDIVCAAVSTLTFTLINELERLRSGEMLKVEHREENGKVHIHVWLKGYKVAECLDTVLTGYRMIQEHYPEHFSITEDWKSFGEVGEK